MELSKSYLNIASKFTTLYSLRVDYIYSYIMLEQAFATVLLRYKESERQPMPLDICWHYHIW